MRVDPKLATRFGLVIAGILSAVFAVEGGYVNNPLDPGGETNHGITKKVAVQNGYTGPMVALPKEKASDIYVMNYIQKPGFDLIIAVDPVVAEEVIDSGVNVGPSKSAKWFQESLNALNDRQKDYPDVLVDGEIGPVTIAAYRSLQKRRGAGLACQLMLKLMDAKQMAFYLSLSAGNSKYEAFMLGWTRARIGNVDPARCAP